MPAWLTAADTWLALLGAALVSTSVAWLRLKRAQLRAARRQYPPTTAPPEPSDPERIRVKTGGSDGDSRKP